MKIKITHRISILKVVFASFAIIGSMSTFSYAASPGNMEAINSASSDRRNIIGIEISTATDPKNPKNAADGCGKEGVLISAVIPGHPAATAGLKVGDVITKINEIRVKNNSEALEAMDGLDAGRSYPFEVCRAENGKAQTLILNVLVEKVQEKAIGKIS